MYLVQFLLPTNDNENNPFPAARFNTVFRELTEQFGGATAYRRAPAEGAWKDESGEVNRDEVVIFEVMVAELERDWWAAYRQALEQRFRQEKVLVRATQVEEL